jgi:hypothetical protein
MSWLILIIVALVGLAVFSRTKTAGFNLESDLVEVWEAAHKPTHKTKYTHGMSYVPSLDCSTVPTNAKNFHVPGTEYCAASQTCYNNAAEAHDARGLCVCAQKGNCPAANSANWG